MTSVTTRPPFDPELATFLTALQARGPFTLTTEMLPRMRALETTEDELDQDLRDRGLVDGRPVEVPADLGIDQHRGLIAELHTHDDSGVLHVESGDSHLTFTLGQLFTEWGVELDAEDLGGLHADGGEQLRAYVDGRPVEGDPGRIELADHQEIALVYGTGQPGHVPDSYDFAAAGL